MAKTMSPELIAERISLAIREKLFAPGSPLVQEDLARRFEVSRSPIREALRILATEGLVTITPGGGATVRQLGQTDLEELYDLRIMIEPTIADYIVEQATKRDVIELTSHTTRMENAPDTATWMRANFDFHSQLYTLANRPHTEEMLRTLLVAVQPYSEENIGRLGGRSQANEEHLAMIAAIREGDAQELADLCRTHLTSARERLSLAHASNVAAEADPLARLRSN